MAKPNSSSHNYLIPFILITSLFFMWGIANNLNGILILHLRKALQLSNMQSTFVDTAVYMAALGGLGFFMSIIFSTISAIFPVIMGRIIDSKGDNIQIGYIVPLLCF